MKRIGYDLCNEHSVVMLICVLCWSRISFSVWMRRVVVRVYASMLLLFSGEKITGLCTTGNPRSNSTGRTPPLPVQGPTIIITSMHN